MKRIKSSIVCFVLLSCVTIFTENSKAADERRNLEVPMPKEENKIFYFEHPNNHRVTPIQYQLHGRIKDLKKSDNGMMFQFEGTVELLLTGTELFSSKGKNQIVHWDVVRLPVEIASWKQTSFPWLESSMTFDKSFNNLSSIEKNGDLIDAAIKDIKLVIGGNGDLLRIEGEEIFRKQE